MSDFKKIYMATLTKNAKKAGTKDSIHLVINDNTGRDCLNVGYDRVTQSGQDYLARARATLFEKKLKSLPIRQGTGKIDTTGLNQNSIRVVIGGPDEWSPEHIIVWGVSEEDVAEPLAAEMQMTTALSSQATYNTEPEGPSSTPLSLVTRGDRMSSVQIRQLLLVVQTETSKKPKKGQVQSKNLNPGTDDHIILRIMSKTGDSLVDHQIADSPQRDQEAGVANLYLLPVNSVFSRADLDDGSVVMSLSGNDAWQPKKVFLFGLDADTSQPRHVVPLVHIDKWTEGKISADPTDQGSKTSYVLKLQPFNTKEKFGIERFPGPLGGVVDPG